MTAFSPPLKASNPPDLASLSKALGQGLEHNKSNQPMLSEKNPCESFVVARFWSINRWNSECNSQLPIPDYESLAETELNNNSGYQGGLAGFIELDILVA